MSHYSKHLFICTNQKSPGKKCCSSAGGEPYFDYLKNKLLELGQYGPGKIRVSKSGCLGRCSSGPGIVIYPDETWYTYSSFSDLDEIIDTHILSGNLVTRLLM